MLTATRTDVRSTLAQRIEESVRRTTHGRVRHLAVEDVQDGVVLHGQATSHHTRQLALHAALEIAAGQPCRSCITVG